MLKNVHIHYSEKNYSNNQEEEHMNNRYSNEVQQLQFSIHQMQQQFNDSLILNPVENIPFPETILPSSSYMHGLYNTDTSRTQLEKYNSKLQFSGRNQVTEDINVIYRMWSELLGGEAISMRLLSGLHAHIVLFMGLTDIGDKVLVLPEKAGGHTSGRAILERLGLVIEEIPYDCENQKVDHDECLKKIKTFKPEVIFIDRSEGLVYEDFTWLCNNCNCYKIFDASQYLTNIICSDYKNPFDMGFDLIISTLHKNLPGPQRAMVCSKRNDAKWHKLRSKISCYVSNMHFYTIYSAGLLLKHYEELQILSKEMLNNATCLENELLKMDVPMIQRSTNDLEPPTHHCWIKPPTKDKAFELYLTLEKIGILTNYRLLPYEIGYGIRLGLSGATRSGLKEGNIAILAGLIAQAYKYGFSNSLKNNTLEFIHFIKSQGEPNEK